MLALDKIIYKTVSVFQPEIEVVERKGIGHPDTLADGLGASASYEYSAYCLKNFGVVLHHRFDKTMVVGGRSQVSFGLGEIIKPIQVYYVGKVSETLGGKRIPWKEILTESTYKYFGRVLPGLQKESISINFNVNSNSRNPYWFNPRDKNDIPDATKPTYNDTSITVGYWPNTPLEELVLACERYFYNSGWKPRFNFVGHDIKVMAVRVGKKVDITMCVPFLGQNTPNVEFYNYQKEIFIEELTELAKKYIEGDVSIVINSEDYIYKAKHSKLKQKGYYLLVSGSALDHGEEGVVGRGNKTSGLISSFRPYSMEAPYGKNPAYYTGVIYAYVANKLARTLSERFACEAQVLILSRNGSPLNQPHKVIVYLSKKVDKKSLYSTIQREFDRTNWTQEILEVQPFVPILS